MASGSYPLDRRDGAGAVLAKIIADLRALLNTEGDDQYANVPNCLPSCYDNTPEDAAADGGYRERLRLARRLMEECLEPPVHHSDCATHNMPARPHGPCDCSVAR